MEQNHLTLEQLKRKSDDAARLFTIQMHQETISRIFHDAKAKCDCDDLNIQQCAALETAIQDALIAGINAAKGH